MCVLWEKKKQVDEYERESAIKFAFVMGSA